MIHTAGLGQCDDPLRILKEGDVHHLAVHRVDTDTGIRLSLTAPNQLLGIGDFLGGGGEGFVNEGSRPSPGSTVTWASLDSSVPAMALPNWYLPAGKFFIEQGLHKGNNLLYYECTERKAREMTKCMEEKDFELLQALVDSRNSTTAADKLYITQSVLYLRRNR